MQETQEMQVPSLGQGDPLEEEMSVLHSITFLLQLTFLIQETELQLVTNTLEIMMFTACVWDQLLSRRCFLPMEEHPVSHHP